MNIIILGPQGSGKGTQAELIAKKYRLEHVDMGRALRGVSKQGTELGRSIYQILNVTHSLVPDDILQKVLRMEIQSLPREQGIILDGAPRKLEQALFLEEVFQALGRKVDKVFFVNIPEAVTVERISKRWVCQKCGAILIMGKDVKSPEDKCPICGGEIKQRTDDTEEGVKQRLQIFRAETMPVIEFYKEKGKLVEIDGNQPVEKVFADITKNIPAND